MTPETDPSNEDRSLNGIIAAYLEAVDAGERPDPDDLMDRHPDLADELRSFFATQDALEAVAQPLRQTRDECIAFGDYELLDELARGGMGIVYRARQISLNRPVALKRIKAGRFADDNDKQRFQTEAEAAANLDHPNIVPIYEVGEHEGQPYFSMKLIEGGNLNEHLTRFHKDVRASVRVMVKVARAVHHAHQRGILHRDLKPGNILIDEAGVPHVTDFGLAKKLEEDGQLTHSGAIVGTPEYMAPEQAKGDKGLTTAADVYGLGAVLYFLLTGQPPFRNDYNWETIKQVVEEEPVRPRSHNKAIDRDLERVCLKCLEKYPDRRFRSAEELADELQRWLDGSPLQHIRVVSETEKLYKWVRRHPAAASVVLMMALACSLLVWIWKQRVDLRLAEVTAQQRVEAEQRVTALQKKVASKNEWLDLFHQAKSDRLDGKRWQALARLKECADRLQKQPDLGDKMRLRNEAFLTINSTAVHLAKHCDHLNDAPRYNEEESAMLLGDRTFDLLHGPVSFKWDDGMPSAVNDENAKKLEPHKPKIDLPLQYRLITQTHNGRWALYRDTKRKLAELWDTQEKKCLTTLGDLVKVIEESPPNPPADFLSGKKLGYFVRIGYRKSVLSEDGHWGAFVTSKDPNRVELFDGTKLKSVGYLGRIGEEHTPCSIHPDNNVLVTLTRDDRIHLWDLSLQRRLMSLGNVDRVFGFSRRHMNYDYHTQLQWSPTGRWLSSRCVGLGKIAFWEFARPNPTYPVEQPVVGLQFSPGGEMLGVDGRVWNVRRLGRQVVLSPQLTSSKADAVRFGTNGQVWEVYVPPALQDGDRPEDPKIVRDPIRVVQVAPHRREFTLPRPQVLRKDGTPLEIPVEVVRLDFSASGKKLAVLYMAESSEFKLILERENSIELDEHRRYLSNWPLYSTEIWDIEHQPVKLWTIPAQTTEFSGGQTHVKDQRLEIGRILYYPRRWIRVSQWKPAPMLHGRALTNYALPAGKGVFSEDETMFAWDASGFCAVKIDGPEIQKLDGKEVLNGPFLNGRKSSISWEFTDSQVRLRTQSYDRRYLVSARTDKSCTLIDLTSGEVLIEWQPHDEIVTAMAFSPDGTTLVTAGADNTLKVWNLEYISQELSALGLGWK